MAFRLLPRQFAISVHNGLHGLSKAHASLIERALLNVAPRQLLDVSDPPVADLLEHAGITVLHTPLFSHQRAGDTTGPQAREPSIAEAVTERIERRLAVAGVDGHLVHRPRPRVRQLAGGRRLAEEDVGDA